MSFSELSQDDVEVTRWRARVAGQAKTLGGKGPVTCLVSKVSPQKIYYCQMVYSQNF